MFDNLLPTSTTHQTVKITGSTKSWYKAVEVIPFSQFYGLLFVHDVAHTTYGNDARGRNTVPHKRIETIAYLSAEVDTGLPSCSCQ